MKNRQYTSRSNIWLEGSNKSIWLLFLTACLLMSSGCEQKASVASPELNEFLDLSTAEENIASKVGFDVLSYENNSSTGSVTVSGNQFSDESLVIDLSAEVDISGDYARILWYQTSGAEAVIVNPESLQTKVILPAVYEESSLGFRFVVVTQDNEVYYDDTSVLVLDNNAIFRVDVTATNEIGNLQIFKLLSSQTFDEDLNIHYLTKSSSAQDNDYTPVNGTVVLPAGSTTVDIPVEIINDLDSEGTEYFVLHISSVDGTYKTTAIGVILDNEVLVDEGTADTEIADYVLPETDNALIFVSCDDAVLAADLEAICAIGGGCDSTEGLINIENDGVSTLISWSDSLPYGDYRFSLENNVDVQRSCQVTVLWDNLARNYSSTLAAGENIYLDFNYTAEALLASQPMNLDEEGNDFELSLLSSTSSSLEISWPMRDGVSYQLLSGSSASDLSFNSTVSGTSVLIDNLNSGENYCFQVLSIDTAGMQLEASSARCLQVPIDSVGALEFQLSWTFDSDDLGPDLDLHVLDPNSITWNYTNAINHINPNLDIDDTGSGNGGPERMYWEAPVNGTYSYSVDWYSNGSSAVTYADYTLRVFVDSVLVEVVSGRLLSNTDTEWFTYDYNVIEN